MSSASEASGRSSRKIPRSPWWPHGAARHFCYGTVCAHSGPRSNPNRSTRFINASLLLVATRQNIYAISPSDPQAFLMNIQHATEMGSLFPAQPESIYPGLIVSAAWQDRLIRYFWLAGLFLNLGLLIWVTLMIPSLGTISLGFLPSGKVGEAVPGVGLVLVPIISLFLYGISWLAGLAFYRTPKQQDLARVVWAGSLVASLLFIVAVLFIVITPI